MKFNQRNENLMSIYASFLTTKTLYNIDRSNYIISFLKVGPTVYKEALENFTLK